mgnify:CR=1 FL=1
MKRCCTLVSEVRCVKQTATVRFFFFQAEDGIRYLVRSRGLGDVYKRQEQLWGSDSRSIEALTPGSKPLPILPPLEKESDFSCLLYTSDAADERSSVDLGGRRIIKQKKKQAKYDHTARLTDHVAVLS